MRLIICGSRNIGQPMNHRMGEDWGDFLQRKREYCISMVAEAMLLGGIDPDQIEKVISGTAEGGDWAGEQWAFANDIPVDRYPADWNRYGKSAGFKRNTTLVEKGTHCLALWDQKSNGTRDTITKSIQAYPQGHVWIYEVDLRVAQW